MEDRDAAELRISLQSLQKDVESKAATIKHLQNAIDAKSMTIGILSKANREGGDLETHIANAIQAKIQAAVKAREEELAGGGAPAQADALRECEQEKQRLQESFTSERRRLEAELAACGEELAAARERAEGAATAREEAVAEAEKLARRQAECERSALEMEAEDLRERLQRQEDRVREIEAEREELQRAAPSEEDRGRLKAVRGSFEALEKVEMRAASAQVRALQAEETATRARQAAEAAEGQLEEERRALAEARGQLERAEAALREAREAGEGPRRQLEEERRQAAEQLGQLRDYQAKAFELKAANDVLVGQLESTQEEMQQMQAEHQGELGELQRELSTLRGDRETQWRAVTEQIDSRLREVRQVAERERDGLLSERAAELEDERRRLCEVTEEADRLRLRCDAQELELRALREAVGGAGAGAEAEAAAAEAAAAEAAAAAPEAAAPEAAAPPAEAAEAPRPAGRERVRALREQSQFAFDEMAKRMAEVRGEAEEQRKRLRADLDQKLHERGAQIVELTNRADNLQTQAETLERERDALVQQRDELSRSLRERERAATATEGELEGLSEAYRLLEQKLAVFRLSQALQRGAVAPAFSLLRRRLAAAPAAGGGPGEEPGEKPGCEDDKVDASTVDGDGPEDAEDEEEDDEEEEEEETYGVDQNGQEEWAEILEANTLNALFTGADAVVGCARAAAGDLTEHVQNIVQSLGLFPQMYAGELRELDRSGKGKELRDFVCKHLARAMWRCQRIASAMAELCSRGDEVVGNLQNLVRAKGLEWHLSTLRAAAQHEVFLRLQRNQMSKLRTDYEDVLEQYGEQCEQSSELERKLQGLEKEVDDLRKAAASPAPAEAPAGGAEGAPAAGKDGSTPKAPGGPRSMEDIHQLMKDIETSTVAEASAKAAETVAKGKGPPGKGKAKGPPPPGAKAAPAAEAPAAEAPPAAEASAEPPAPAAAKGPGKGKGKAKGPPPPGAKLAAAPAEAAPAEPTPPDAAQQEAPKAPSGKGKGPPPPGKGKGPPPPPPGKGQPPPAPEAAAEAAAPAGPAPGGKGKGPGAPPGKGPGPPGPGGKGGPPAKGKAAKGAAKGAALPSADPGPEPPRDLQPKQFHWTNIVGNRFQTSIFADLHAEAAPEAEGAPPKPARGRRVKLDLGALTSAFFQKKKQEPSPEELAKAAASKKKTVAQCLDGKKSQAVEIFLNGCGVKLEHVQGCVLELDEKAMAVDHLAKVIEFYPDAEESGTLRAFQQENDPTVLPWGRAEEFLISLMRVPDFKLRGECCLARGQFGEEFSGIAQDVGSLRSCLSSIVASTALRSIFALVMQMGNYLNFGSKKGCQLGFTLDTLPLLGRVEGAGDKTYSLMRFLMDTLEMDRAVRDEALEELKLCEACSKLDFVESVRRLNELERGVANVADIVGAGASEGGERKPPKLEDEKFCGTLRTFVDGAQGQLTSLRSQVEEVTEAAKKCIDLYAEKPKTPIAETLKKFADFRKDMEEARRTNLLARAKKEKAEKRRLEKESAAKAKAAKAAPADAAANGGAAPAASSRAGGDAKTTAPAPKGAMRKMKVKIPDKPLLAHPQPRRGAEAPSGKAGLPRETSSGLAFGQDFHPPERERMSMGPLSRPDALRVSSSLGGRISIGLAHASADKGLSRAELMQQLLAGAGSAREAPS